jgi:hypothetical protein
LLDVAAITRENTQSMKHSTMQELQHSDCKVTVFAK